MNKKNKPQRVWSFTTTDEHPIKVVIHENAAEKLGIKELLENKAITQKKTNFDKYLEDEIKSDPTLEKELKRYDKEIDEEVEAYNRRKKFA